MARIADMIPRSLSVSAPVRQGRVAAVPLHATATAAGGGFGENDPAIDVRGGGGMSISRPVAVAEISARGVRIHPVVDVQRILLLAVLMALGAGLGLLLILWMRRRREHQGERR
ncbi:MAG: hypothetical protein AAFV53_11045 [Myxococcota bacterium]